MYRSVVHMQREGTVPANVLLSRSRVLIVAVLEPIFNPLTGMFGLHMRRSAHVGVFHPFNLIQIRHDIDWQRQKEKKRRAYLGMDGWRKEASLKVFFQTLFCFSCFDRIIFSLRHARSYVSIFASKKFCLIYMSFWTLSFFLLCQFAESFLFQLTIRNKQLTKKKKKKKKTNSKKLISKKFSLSRRRQE